MRTPSLLGVGLLLLCCVAASAQAADPSPQPNLCTVDSPACRNLAVEIAVLDIQDRIDTQVELGRGANHLCPEDNPNCCPPRLMPFCSQVQRDIVVEARRAYQSRAVGSYNDCPWSKPICDSLGGFYCGPGTSWTPWTGCLDIGIPPIDCPPGWKQTEFGVCEPPPPCPCGFIHNPKGICIPKPCFRLGQLVPCLTFCGELEVLSPAASPQPPESPLERHLLDSDVHLEAAKRVRENLKLALETVEKEIEELSSY